MEQIKVVKNARVIYRYRLEVFSLSHITFSIVLIFWFVLYGS